MEPTTRSTSFTSHHTRAVVNLACGRLVAVTVVSSPPLTVGVGAAGLVLLTLLALLFRTTLKADRAAGGVTYASAVAAAAAAALSGPPTCAGEPFAFVEYTPSAFEELWARNADAWSREACATLHLPEHRERVGAWLAATIPLNTPAFFASAPALLAGDPALAVFSRMRYRYNGTVVDVGLEPLAGVLRDPRSVCGPDAGMPPNADIQSHEFLGVDPEHLRRVRADIAAALQPRRVLLFDLGCTRWGDTRMPGLRWLHDTYAAAGLPFTDIYGWEADASRSAGFFDGMPLEVLSAFHFYARAANNEPASPDNPLEVLKHVANPRDFVVFKLDIDTPFMEKRIIVDILRDPRYSCLIDELYFEHHTTLPAMTPSWGSSVEGSLHDSIALFQALRRVGIRAHSWP